jgi:hypothetical protein
VKAGHATPGVDHQQADGNQDRCQSNAERHNQQESKTHPLQGNSTQQHHQSSRAGDNPACHAQGQELPQRDGFARAGVMVRLVDVVMVCIPCSMGMGVAVAMGVPMGMRVILPGIPPQE